MLDRTALEMDLIAQRQQEARVNVLAIAWINAVRRENGMPRLDAVPERDRDTWRHRARVALAALDHHDRTNPALLSE